MTPEQKAVIEKACLMCNWSKLNAFQREFVLRLHADRGVLLQWEQDYLSGLEVRINERFSKETN